MKFSNPSVCNGRKRLCTGRSAQVTRHVRRYLMTVDPEHQSAILIDQRLDMSTVEFGVVAKLKWTVKIIQERHDAVAHFNAV